RRNWRFRRGLGVGSGSPQDAAPGPYMAAHRHLQFNRGAHKHVNTRAELDQSHTLSALESVPGPLPEYDSSRQQASDLLYHHGPVLALDREDVLFVLERGEVLGSDPEGPLAMADVPDRTCNRRTVHVNV